MLEAVSVASWTCVVLSRLLAFFGSSWQILGVLGVDSATCVAFLGLGGFGHHLKYDLKVLKSIKII